jgi:SulP family sulfate permease
MGTVQSLPEDLGSPRRQILHQAATSAIKEERQTGPTVVSTPSFQHFKQPLPLLMQIFHDLSDKNEDFWFKIAPYFVKENIPVGTILWNQGVRSSIFIAHCRMNRARSICLKVGFCERAMISSKVFLSKQL